MLLGMKDIRKGQKEVPHIIFDVKGIVNIKQKQKHTNCTVYNGIMLHQCINIYHVIFPIYFIVMASNNNLSPSKYNTTGTDLSNIHTEDEEQIDTTDWMPPKCKKLQHMMEFHEEYQCVFGEKASIHTIMKNRITHMNPPMPDSVCQGEMQSTTLENNVIIEYITDAQGIKVKKLKPLLTRAEQIENILIIHIVMITYQKYLRIILHRKEK